MQGFSLTGGIMSLVKIAGYFNNKKREGHPGKGAAIGAGLGLAGGATAYHLANRGTKNAFGLGIKEMAVLRGLHPSAYTKALLASGALVTAAGAGIGAGLGGLVRTKKKRGNK